MNANAIMLIIAKFALMKSLRGKADENVNSEVMASASFSFHHNLANFSDSLSHDVLVDII